MEPMSAKIFGKTLSLEEDILQCIDVLIHTPKGAIPLDPGFGCDAWMYIDLPFSMALPKMVKAISDAISVNEKRVTIDSVTSEQEDISKWHLMINYKRNVNGSMGQYKYTINGRA